MKIIWRKSWRVDHGLIVVVLVATLAAWPLLTRPSLPTFTDDEHHVYRTYEIIAAWEQGVPYLRWAPDLFFGYGYPIFNYYAPLTYYLGAAYGWFLGGPVASVKFVFVASAYLGALGMYLLSRRQWGPLGGVVSAAAYVLAPYIVYINPLWRGVSPETFAVALGPWLLWACARARRTAAPGDVAIAAVILAALILAHNLVSFLFAGLLLGWVAWDLAIERVRTRAQPGQSWGRELAPLGVTLLLGAALSAFMWLPAALERNAVQFQRAFAPTPLDTSLLQLVKAQDLFAPISFQAVENADIAKNRAFQLGLPQWLLGLLGALTLFNARTRQSATAFFALAVLVMIYFMLPVSAAIWKTIPQLTYLQFPWRLLGPAAVALGWLAGGAVNLVPPNRRWLRLAVGVGAVSACLAAAMPVLNPLPWADYGPVTPRRIFMMEQNGILGIGTTIQFEFLPITVTSRPGLQESLLNSYEAGLVDKVNRAALPQEAQVTVTEHGPTHDLLQIASPIDFDLNLFTFYFPGWTAYVDGVKTPIEISKPEGFITVPAPAGTHEVLVRFEDTPPRRWGWIISGLALAVLAGLVVWQIRLGLEPPRTEALAWRSAAMFSVVVLIGMGMLYVADRASPWQVDLPSYDVPGAQQQRFVRLESNVALLAYDLPQKAAHPGDQVPLTFYWKAMGRVPLDLSVFVHLFGPDGKLWGQSDKLVPVNFYPTGRWPLNRYFRDDHLATLRPDAPPGEYTVVVGLWDRYAGNRMHVLDANGNVTDQDGVVLTTQFVVQP